MIHHLCKSMGFVFATSVAATAFAAGFEPSIPFGGQTAGVAGIGTPYVTGSQALYFNPAGLAGDSPAHDVSLNLSPSWGEFKGPAADVTHQEASQKKILVPFGLMYAQRQNENWGWGAGLYVSGGSYANYPSLDFSGYGIAEKLELKSDLTLLEFAAGLGYKVMPGLKIGATWRVLMADADLTLVSSSLRYMQMRDLKDTQYNGFKLGAQYKLGSKTEFGLTYRSEVTFKAKGTVSGMDYGIATPIAKTGVTVGSLFPAALTLGVVQELSESWKILSEFVFTQYSKATNLAVNETGQTGAPIELKWKDQSEIRLAGQYSGAALPIRFGYIWSSQVTHSDYASPTFTPPGSAQTLTLGSSKTLGLSGEQSLQLSGGLEYLWSQGRGTGAPAKYELHAYGLHFGVQYSF